MNNSSKDKQTKETQLEMYNDISIKSKDYLDIYTKLVHMESFRNNNIKNVIKYVPFILDENGEVVIENRQAGGNPFNNDGVNSVYRMLVPEDKSDTAPLVDPSEKIELFDEDNTLSEIIDEKVLQFRNGKIVPKINEDSSIIKEMKDQGKDMEVINNFVTTSSEALSSLAHILMNKIEESKYFPFTGLFYIPIAYNNQSKEQRPNHRKINVTPFTLDFDESVSNFNDANWVIATEKINYNEFRKRCIANEYSLINIDGRKKSENIEKEIIRKWNEKASYKFVTKKFAEQAITRNATLRASSFSNLTVEDNIDINMFGVIEYMFIKDYIKDQWMMRTFLNGVLIGELSVDKAIDVLPFIPFSEKENFLKNTSYNGNIGFKLLPSQNSILVMNYLKRQAVDDMSPIIMYAYAASEEDKDLSEDLSDIKINDNKATMVQIGVKNPQQANNLSRTDSGAALYGNYIQVINESIANLTATMKMKAGITDFMQGTDSASFQSASGLDAMKVAGLSKELDVVASLKQSLNRLAVTEAYFSIVNIVNNNNAKSKQVIDETGILRNIKDSYSSVLNAYADILKYEFETDYQKQFTNSILQSTLVPLAAQSGHFDISLGLLKALPLTQELQDGIEVAIGKLEQMKKQQQEQEQQQQEQQPNPKAGNTPQTGGKKSKPNKPTKKQSNSK